MPQTAEEIAELADAATPADEVNEAAEAAHIAAAEKAVGDKWDQLDAEEEPNGATLRDRQRQAEEADELGLEEADADEHKDADDTAEDDAAGEEEPDDGPTLTPTLHQAAKRAGWSDDDIDEFVDANQELAEKTFSNLHDNQNRLSRDFAAIGQQLEASGIEAEQGSASPLNETFTPEQLEGFKEKYGSEFMDEIVAPIMRPIQEMQAQSEAREQRALKREVDGHFDALGSEYSDIFGNGQEVSGRQSDERFECCRLADQIRSGALHQGKDMPVKDALEAATAMHAIDKLAESERKTLTAKVKKRHGSITQRPTKRKAMKSKKTGAEAAEEAYAARAKELGFETGDGYE